MIFFQGSFDIINGCHIKCFKDISKHGNITIGLNSDKLIHWYKKRNVIMPFNERKEVLLAIRYIEDVVTCDDFSPMKQLKKYKPQMYVLGSEWVDAHKEEIDFVKSYGGKILVTSFYNQFLHSSDIRKKIKNENTII